MLGSVTRMWRVTPSLAPQSQDLPWLCCSTFFWDPFSCPHFCLSLYKLRWSFVLCFAVCFFLSLICLSLIFIILLYFPTVFHFIQAFASFVCIESFTVYWLFLGFPVSLFLSPCFPNTCSAALIYSRSFFLLWS